MAEQNMAETKTAALGDVAQVRYLTGSNTEVFSNNGFPGITITTEGAPETHARVWLHRAFPFAEPENYISVQNKDQEEIGLIRSLGDFTGEAREILEAELARKYYTPKIQKIRTLKEARGYSFWEVESDAGELQFTLQDTFRSLLRVGEDKVFVFDNYGNRYVIESLAALDPRSLRKLELYL